MGEPAPGHTPPCPVTASPGARPSGPFREGRGQSHVPRLARCLLCATATSQDGTWDSAGRVLSCQEGSDANIRDLRSSCKGETWPQRQSQGPPGGRRGQAERLTPALPRPAHPAPPEPACSRLRKTVKATVDPRPRAECTCTGKEEVHCPPGDSCVRNTLESR